MTFETAKLHGKKVAVAGGKIVTEKLKKVPSEGTKGLDTETTDPARHGGDLSHENAEKTKNNLLA